MKVLVVNSGSSSVKYQVVDAVTGDPLVVGMVERIGAGGALLSCLLELGFLGIEVDGPANEALVGGAEGTFHAGPVVLAVVRTGEELVIALEAERLAGCPHPGNP